MILGGVPDAGVPGNPTMLGVAWDAERLSGPKQPRPDSPGDPIVTAASDGVITIQWSDLSSNETGFIIEHQIQSGSTWNGAGTFTVGPSRDTATLSVAAGTHRFRVAAFNSGGNSRWTSWSPPVTVAGPATPDPLPAAPQNLVAVPTDPPAAVLRWEDASANESGFQVERNPVFSDGMHSVAANISTFRDTVTVGTFQYRVRAVNANGSSAFTPWTLIVLTSSPPVAPSSPVASDAGNERDINLAWADNSDNEVSFVIEREKQLGSLWGELTQLTAPANATALVDHPGAGTYRYHIAAANSIGQSSFTSWASATAADGWTQFTPSSDTRIVYVSSSTGDDTYDGLSEARPKRTIAAGYAVLRDRYPDWLLLRRGDRFAESRFWGKSGRSVTERMLFGAYGSGTARPVIDPGVQHAIFRQSTPDVSYVAFVGLHAQAASRAPDTLSRGLNWLGGGSGNLVEDCMFEGFATNINLQGNNQVLRDFTIRRCVIVDSYAVGSHSQGLYAGLQSGLVVEENVFDHNGWKEDVADPTIFNHAMYLDTGGDASGPAVVRCNIVTNSASHGMQVRCGGEVTGNVVVHNPLGILFGGGTIPQPGGVNGVVRGNIVMEGSDITPSLPRAYGIDLKNLNRGLIEDNIVAMEASAGEGGFAIGYYASGGPEGMGLQDVTIRNNLVYNWGISFFCHQPADGAVITGVLLEGNVFQQLASGANPMVHLLIPSTDIAFHSNTYYTVSASDRWYYDDGIWRSFAGWMAASGEADARSSEVPFEDPGRTLASYSASLGGPSTLGGFVSRAREQSRLNWRAEYTAERVVEYIRAGYEPRP